MIYYCNYSVKKCPEEILKELKYIKGDSFYNISNGIGINQEEFDKILKKFKDYKLMVFISKPYDSFIDLGISDVGSEMIDYQIPLTPFDYSDEELFINEVYPTDSFIFKQIDDQTGMMIKLDYENPYETWWNGEVDYKNSFNKKSIIAKQGYYNYGSNTKFGVEMKLPKNNKALSEKELLVALKNKKISLDSLTEEMKDNEKIVTIAVKNKASELKFASDRIKNNKEFIMKMYRHYEKEFIGDKIISNIGNELKNNKEFFSPLVKRNPNLYRYIGKSLKDDLDFLLLSPEGAHYYASSKVNNKIKNDREYAINAVKKGYYYNDLPEEYQNDREFALEAVKENGGNYQILPLIFKVDKEIALIALKKCKEIVKYSIPDELKNDSDIKKYL